MDRRSFLKNSTLATLTTAAALYGLEQVPAAGEKGQEAADAVFAHGIPTHIALSWSDDPTTTQTVTWQTDAGVANGVVEFQAGGTLAGAARAEAAGRDFTTDLGPSRLYSAVLRGLTPNTRYSYRVGDGTHWSSTHSFTTAEAKAVRFKFLLFGDSQSGTTEPIYTPWAITVHNAFRAHPDARFMMNVGDLVEYGQSGAHWNAWFDGAQGVIDTLPQMPSDGNHETYPGTWPIFFDAQFRLPPNGPETLRQQAYSFNYGNVHFAVIDSQEAEEKHDILKTQASWLEADLAASTAPWKIVLYHRTPYDIKIARSNEPVKRAFSPVLDKYHVDLTFNGHDHGVARTFPVKGDIFSHKPSEGTVYYVTGRSGNKTYDDLVKKPYNSFFKNPLEQPNYLVVEVEGLRLTVKAYFQDGTLIDSYLIDKANDVTSDSALALPQMAVVG